MPKSDSSQEHALEWVSDLNLPSFRNPASPSTPPSLSPTPNYSAVKVSLGKRKRSNNRSEEEQDSAPSKVPTTRLTRQALRTIPGNSSMGKNSSPKKNSSRAGASTELDPAKLTSNLHNTRLSLAYSTLHYSKPEVKKKYPEFFEKVAGHLRVDRASRMAPKSAEKCIDYAYTNATKAEKSYFREMNPLVFKDNYTKVSAKRNFEGELKRQEGSFEKDDNLTSSQDVLLPACTLPYTPGEALGLSTPKPDWLYGMKQDMNPLPDEQVPDYVQPLLSFGTDMAHIFFAIENKGCEGTIEEAENQCLRTGAALVHARRQLNRMADNASKRAVSSTNGPPHASPAAITPLDPTSTTTNDLPTPPASSSTSSAPDYDSFYFTCAWVPSVARIFVHWYEDLGTGKRGIFHMTRMKDYLASNEDHLTEFRMVGHNIFDWGIYVNQKASKAALAKIVEMANKERVVSP